MPECRKCHRVTATAEMRRTTAGHVCKDTWNCSQRVKQAKTSPRTAREVKKEQ